MLPFNSILLKEAKNSIQISSDAFFKSSQLDSIKSDQIKSNLIETSQNINSNFADAFFKLSQLDSIKSVQIKSKIFGFSDQLDSIKLISPKMDQEYLISYVAHHCVVHSGLVRAVVNNMNFALWFDYEEIIEAVSERVVYIKNVFRYYTLVFPNAVTLQHVQLVAELFNIRERAARLGLVYEHLYIGDISQRERYILLNAVVAWLNRLMFTLY